MRGGAVRHRVSLGGGAGYDDTLPSMIPFMFVENHQTFGDIGVIAFGAYNAYGLIGSEKGGVAVVLEKPTRGVLATKDVPWRPDLRAEEFMKVVELIQKHGGTRKKAIPQNHKSMFVDELISEGYEVRGL
jgi:hypothetical protein